jgi:hypothetical protein
LIEALGGGWDASQLPTPAQVSEKVTKSDIESVNQTNNPGNPSHP